MRTIDWLTVTQDAPGVPDFGGDRVLCFESDGVSPKWEQLRSRKFDGSYCSDILVRCQNERVSVSGNPSRFNQPHSLDGLTSVADCVSLYNDILYRCELPPFSASVIDSDLRALRGVSVRRGGDARYLKGMSITRIDIASLFSVGSEVDAFSLIRALSQVMLQGKPAIFYPNGATVHWFGRKHSKLFVKYYIKHVDLLQHSAAHCAEVIAWARSVGLIRFEVEFKRKQLDVLGLRRPSSWSQEVMESVTAPYLAHQKLGFGRSGLESIAADLIALGVPAARATRAQAVAFEYVATGKSLCNLGRSQRYVIRADLLRVGLDIFAPLNVSALPVKVREINLSSVLLPEFARRRA